MTHQVPSISRLASLWLSHTLSHGFSQVQDPSAQQDRSCFSSLEQALDMVCLVRLFVPFADNFCRDNLVASLLGSHSYLLTRRTLELSQLCEHALGTLGDRSRTRCSDTYPTRFGTISRVRAVSELNTLSGLDGVSDASLNMVNIYSLQTLSHCGHSPTVNTLSFTLQHGHSLNIDIL